MARGSCKVLYFLVRNCFRLKERKASHTRQDFAVYKAGLTQYEVSQINFKPRPEWVADDKQQRLTKCLHLIYAIKHNSNSLRRKIVIARPIPDQWRSQKSRILFYCPGSRSIL